ncbi:hypothetical protein [Actinokineospora sp. NBRC 105648]|uniref:hypothetical protein n=1 Tax=Actinokineospora sp. NBRC 105648 TaxID=3032206 RepID=UPI0024A30891|nr:hypothetical protein [Actinokineospora sp. NBRC 105648]GLZ39301.1 hypothetical protein Acsp05_29250 [Actinokineospora sp. NBRC 105648]
MSRNGRIATALTAVAAAVAVAIAVPAVASPGPAPVPAPAGTTSTTYTSGFESADWQGWSPEDGGNSRGWWIDHSTAQAHGGTTSLNYQLDGTWDNGTIWIEKVFTGPVNTAVPVTVSYWAWSPAAGGPGAGIWATTASVQNTDHVLGNTAGNAPWTNLGTWDHTPEHYYGSWHQYTVSTTVDTTVSSGAINVAIALHANFESKRTYLHFDDVSVTIG